MKKRWLILPCLLLTALALGLYPLLSRSFFDQQQAPPPGVHARENRLLRIWLVGDVTGADGYLRQQAAAFEKAHGDIRVYLRTALADELAAPEAVLPDGVIFGPGAIPAPESLLVPLTGDWAISQALLRSGAWQGQQYALPLLLGGYALVTDQPAFDAPSLMNSATPARTQGKRRISATYSLQCAPGAPLLLAATLMPQPVAQAGLPEDFAQLSQGRVYQDFTSRRCHGAVLTLRQLRAFQALASAGKGFSFSVRAFPSGFTDLCLAGGVVSGGSRQDALAFLQYLLAPSAQQALGDYGLFSVDGSLSLYTAETPLLDQAELMFSQGAALPNLFAFDPAQMDALGRSAFYQGTDLQAILSQIQ